jgi:long-chain acyl-CoA synthetase
VLDAEGWLHTGDLGCVEMDGYLRLNGRKKELLCLIDANKVEPQSIENALKVACPCISHAILFGEQKEFVVALVTLNDEIVKTWAQARAISLSASYTDHPAIQRMIEDAVDRVNLRLAPYEHVRKFSILPNDLSREGGELTPTLKIRRNVVAEKFRTVLASLYA